MNRLPWHRSPPYGGLGDDGGTERLETDVMRFMAILAFCLVAIFALVQSISTTDPAAVTQAPAAHAEAPAVVARATAATDPVTAPETAATAEQTVIEAPAAYAEAVSAVAKATAPAEPVAAPVAAATVEQTVVRTPDAELREPAREPPERTPPPPAPRRMAAVAAVTAAPAPGAQPEKVIRPPDTTTLRPNVPDLPAAPQTANDPSPPAETQLPARPERGFTLRFESGAALTQLVRRGDVNLYAFTGRDAWQLMVVGGRATFRTAQEPRQFHEMTPSTVPEDVVTSFRRGVIASAKVRAPGPTLTAQDHEELSRLVKRLEKRLEELN